MWAQCIPANSALHTIITFAPCKHKLHFARVAGGPCGASRVTCAPYLEPRDSKFTLPGAVLVHNSTISRQKFFTANVRIYEHHNLPEKGISYRRSAYLPTIDYTWRLISVRHRGAHWFLIKNAIKYYRKPFLRYQTSFYKF